ncbi:alpha-galactosidase [Microbacterium horticulturae]|uniref:alpha-galactosidase n=1 Tax=Microbacterium horticulturae TaxID=3028316 RepID=A0ABY8BV33_9MICO|nr:alpha-galactosidase [Microbacterium sp. KACC 23027]WEG08036.1 alpha-galactosidase [Microbacterium sp. KACC 23027]
MTDVFELARDGVSVVVDAAHPGLPRMLHWGAALGIEDDALETLGTALDRQTAPGTLDAAWDATLLPDEGDGFSGRPGLQLRRSGVLLRTRWQLDALTHDETQCTVEAVDDVARLRLRVEIEVVAGGVVWVRAVLRNHGDEPVDVDWLEPSLPVPTTTSHTLTFDGRWSREKRPTVSAMPPGATVRQTRRGRPGHDATTMLVASVGEPQWASGSVWGVHAAWPADTSYRLDRVTDQLTRIGAGELLRPGEITLAAGDEYAAPAVAFVFSADGMDGLAARTHTMLRARPRHPVSPRPLTLNTWEAVYFDHDPARLRALAERAAALGFERFVLDDGWFAGRRDDTTSLGDWVVDRTVWPEGLAPLADRVHELGMQFGLWFEPEMVSLRSDVARAHPDWLQHDPRHLDHAAELSWRTQYVMDLANPDAYAHVFGQIDALVGKLGIDAIKWDHNRDLVESVHEGRPGVHAQTLAFLRMVTELKSRHPGLEIESCSSGGARTDLGALSVCDRVWASDSNDPVERQDIQRWTGLLLPPELVGAHVGPAVSHSSGRATDLSYRLATSLMGSAGFESDLFALDEAESDRVAAFAGLYKRLRAVVHSGRTSHPELRDPAWRVTAFTAPEAAAAVVVAATVSSLEDARAERLRLRDLAEDRVYRVRVCDEIGTAQHGWIAPPWFSAGEIQLPGAVLREVGLQLPTLWPVQAFVLEVAAVA